MLSVFLSNCDRSRLFGTGREIAHYSPFGKQPIDSASKEKPDVRTAQSIGNVLPNLSFSDAQTAIRKIIRQ